MAFCALIVACSLLKVGSCSRVALDSLKSALEVHLVDVSWSVGGWWSLAILGHEVVFDDLVVNSLEFCS